ncbi:hypothetical protein EV359DRAFT_63297 [Lentinula novae-zelandiae]|nr:hypothetical protein EV359DRAFT_63297 [Lentinula novae-zelandiae]
MNGLLYHLLKFTSVSGFSRTNPRQSSLIRLANGIVGGKQPPLLSRIGAELNHSLDVSRLIQILFYRLATPRGGQMYEYLRSLFNWRRPAAIDFCAFPAAHMALKLASTVLAGYREQCRLVHYLPETFIQGSNYFWMNENLFITELGQLIFSDSFSRLSLTLPTPAEFSVGQFSEFNVVVRKVVKYCRIHKLVDQDIVGPRIAPFTILNPYRSIMHIDWQSLCQRETLWAATPANDHHTKRDYTPQRSRALLIPPYYGALG